MFNSQVNLTGMSEADHVLRYLRGTAHYHIKFTRDLTDAAMTNKLWGCVDSDWAGDTDTRRSHTGYVLCSMVVMYHGNLDDKTPCLYLRQKPNL